jgi:hypothetical protein
MRTFHYLLKVFPRLKNTGETVTMKMRLFLKISKALVEKKWFRNGEIINHIIRCWIDYMKRNAIRLKEVPTSLKRHPFLFLRMKNSPKLATFIQARTPSENKKNWPEISAVCLTEKPPKTNDLAI